MQSGGRPGTSGSSATTSPTAAAAQTSPVVDDYFGSLGGVDSEPAGPAAAAAGSPPRPPRQRTSSADRSWSSPRKGSPSRPGPGVDDVTVDVLLAFCESEIHGPLFAAIVAYCSRPRGPKLPWCLPRLQAQAGARKSGQVRGGLPAFQGEGRQGLEGAHVCTARPAGVCHRPPALPPSRLLSRC